MSDFKVLEGGTEGTKYNYFAIHAVDENGRETVVRTGKLNRPFRQGTADATTWGQVAVDVDAKGFRLTKGTNYRLYVQDRKNGRKVELGTISGTVASKEARKLGGKRVVRTDY